MPPGAVAFVLITTTVLSYNEQQKAARAQRRADKARANMDRLRRQREKQRQVRESRIANANNEATAQATGTGGSSSVAGANASLDSQLSSNLSFLDQAQQIGDVISANNQKAASAQGRAAIFNTASQIAGSYLTAPTDGTTATPTNQYGPLSSGYKY